MNTVPLPSPDLYVNNENGECFAWGAEANPDMKDTHEPFYTATQLTDYAAAVSAAKDAEISALKKLIDFDQVQVNQELRGEIERLRGALKDVRDCMHQVNSVPNGPINDTIWYSSYETLFDYIDAALKGTP